MRRITFCTVLLKKVSVLCFVKIYQCYSVQIKTSILTCVSTTMSFSFWHFPIISVIHMVREISPPSHVLASQEKTLRKGRVSSSRCAALQRVGYFRTPVSRGRAFLFLHVPDTAGTVGLQFVPV